MDELNEALRVVPELYFLIAKFLSGGPLKETAKTLLKELESVEVLPRRLDWEGNEHPQSYDELASQYSDVSWNRLASVCERALSLARSVASLPAPVRAVDGSPSSSAVATATATATATASPQADLSEKLTARLSLLSETLVRPKPKYASHKQDHSLVRRLVSRELGCGGAGRAGGRGGEALFAPRLLSGLQLQRRTLGHLSAVYCLVFDCTGRYVVTGADDLLVKVWNAYDGRLLATLRGAGAEITDVCASADGALLACGSVERLVRVWDLCTGAPTAVLHAHAGTITAVHWAPLAHDVRWLASTSTDGSVAFWTCADGQFLSQPVQYVERLRPGACHMICAAWSAGGAFLAAGSADHHVRLYAVHREPGGPRRVLETAVHNDAVDSIAWAHRGLRFVSGSKDGTAALWTLHATQWRHALLLPHSCAADSKRLKVTMVCWDCSDAYVITAVSDNTIRVWCSRSCAQVSCLKGHRDEAYVLEAHPFLPAVLLSAGHDGQLFVWDAEHGEVLAQFHNHIEGQGDGAIFDAKWGGGATVAASDSHGHLLLLGLGHGHRLLRSLPTELFFHTDYRPLVRDALGGALDEQTEIPPHLMPPPFLVDVEGAPHAPQLQRLVPGRELLALSQLIPAAPAHRALDRMIQALAGEADGPAAAPSGVWRGEGVRHTAGSWQHGDPLLVPHSTRPLVPPLAPAHAHRVTQAHSEMYALEQAWYRREMRRRPLMISTAAAAARPRRRAGRPHAPHPPRPPRPLARQEEPPEPESVSSDTSDESVRLSASARDSRDSRTTRSSHSSGTASDDTSSSSSSQYSDWEAGAALAPPARARRRPLPSRRYSPSAVAAKRHERTDGPTPTTSTAAPTTASTEDIPANLTPTELSEAYRVGEWLTAVSPRKAPYHPQMGDECLYFRLGHQRYFEAVAEKDLYKINPRDKPWERTHVNCFDGFIDHLEKNPDSEKNIKVSGTEEQDHSNEVVAISSIRSDNNEIPHTSNYRPEVEECDEDIHDHESSDSDNETNSINVRAQIQQWALKYQIPHNALNELMAILRDHPNTDFTIFLPRDSRSLLKTPRSNNILPIGTGKYWYYGIENSLKDVLYQDMTQLPTCMFLTFNIDGLPISKSTKNEFWPILCKIDCMDIAPLVLAIYFGTTKPPLEMFLRPFVNELLKLLKDGLLVKNQIINIKIRCFICDTPARCFIKGTVGFNSYHGCMKCTVIGEYDRRGRHMSFPRTDMPLRTDHTFRNRLDPDHHKEKSAIEDLPIDLVNDFTIADALHLLDLGVMKRCLLGWTSGSFNFQTKWSAREIQDVSRKIMEIKVTTPTEIQQGRMRGLDTLHFWKAAEFKNFLLYFGPVVLIEYLSFEVYQHFLTLFCATTICYSDIYKPYRHIAEKLFINYIEKFAEIYGQDSVSSNIHNLCHIINDVSRFGSLSTLNAYPFESMLFRIKKMLRKGNQPLEQVANRIQELSKLNVENLKCKQQAYPVFKHESFLETGEKVYNTVKIYNGYQLSKNIKDKWFLSRDNNIIEMIYAIFAHDKIKIIGKKIKNKFDFFERPFNSSHINIYATSIDDEAEETEEYDLKDIKCKLLCMTSNTEMIFIPILTTLGVEIK